MPEKIKKRAPGRARRDRSAVGRDRMDASYWPCFCEEVTGSTENLPRNDSIMPEDLTSEAVAAVRVAAERLGVDSFRLARFLADGRLADILETFGRDRGPGDLSRRFRLAEEYLLFLESEIELHNGRKAPARTNGDRP